MSHQSQLLLHLLLLTWHVFFSGGKVMVVVEQKEGVGNGVVEWRLCSACLCSGLVGLGPAGQCMRLQHITVEQEDAHHNVLGHRGIITHFAAQSRAWQIQTNLSENWV